jgi:hypothetical protein
MVELGLDAGLVEETREERAVGVVISADRLDDDGSFGALDAHHRREEDLAHSTARDALEEAEALELAGQPGLKEWIIFP